MRCSTRWGSRRPATLRAANGTAGDFFGTSVALAEPVDAAGAIGPEGGLVLVSDPIAHRIIGCAISAVQQGNASLNALTCPVWNRGSTRWGLAHLKGAGSTDAKAGALHSFLRHPSGSRAQSAQCDEELESGFASRPRDLGRNRGPGRQRLRVGLPPRRWRVDRRGAAARGKRHGGGLLRDERRACRTRRRRRRDRPRGRARALRQHLRRARGPTLSLPRLCGHQNGEDARRQVRSSEGTATDRRSARCIGRRRRQCNRQLVWRLSNHPLIP
jgi:hypothetical protein